jgi:hypothetical protein
MSGVTRDSPFSGTLCRAVDLLKSPGLGAEHTVKKQRDIAWGSNQATPKLRRLWGARRAISGVVAFSNTQPNAEKPQETCGSRRQRRGRHVRLEDRLEQGWEPESNLRWARATRHRVVLAVAVEFSAVAVPLARHALADGFQTDIFQAPCARLVTNNLPAF